MSLLTVKAGAVSDSHACFGGPYWLASSSLHRRGRAQTHPSLVYLTCLISMGGPPCLWRNCGGVNGERGRKEGKGETGRRGGRKNFGREWNKNKINKGINPFKKKEIITGYLSFKFIYMVYYICWLAMLNPPCILDDVSLVMVDNIFMYVCILFARVLLSIL